MKKVLSFIGGSIVVVVTIYTLFITDTGGYNDENVSDQEYLLKFAEANNETCPFEVDPGIVMQRVIIEPIQVIVFEHEISNFVKSDRVLVSLLSMQPDYLIDVIKTSPEFTRIRNMDATIIFRYNDASGQMVKEVRLDPEDYQ